MGAPVRMSRFVGRDGTGIRCIWANGSGWSKHSAINVTQHIITYGNVS